MCSDVAGVKSYMWSERRDSTFNTNAQLGSCVLSDRTVFELWLYKTSETVSRVLLVLTMTQEGTQSCYPSVRSWRNYGQGIAGTSRCPQAGSHRFGCDTIVFPTVCTQGIVTKGDC